VSAAGHAAAARALIAAARRALERDDRVEFEQLWAEADEQVGLMIEALPLRRVERR
jgi:hypothetical protein